MTDIISCVIQLHMIKYNQLINIMKKIGDRSIPKNITTKALKALCDTLNFIDIWLKLFEDKYDARCVAYITDMKDIFKQIPQTMSKPITQKKKSRNL